VVAAFAVLTLVLGLAGSALAVDAPRWVAALFVDAQKSVGLRWMPVPGATGYKVLRSETKGSGHKEIGTVTAPQYFDQTVEPGSTYSYVLQAVAGAEVSANSDEKSVVIPGQKVKKINPPDWRQIQEQQTTEFGKTTFKVGLSWTKNADAVAYNIYRSEVAGKDYQLLASSSEDAYVDATVAEGKTYYYVLTALDSGFQETPYSGEKSVTLKKVEEKKEKEKSANPKLAVKGSKVVMNLAVTNDGQFMGAPDLALDSEGNLHAPDISGKVRVFGLDGSFIREYGEPGPGPGKLAYPLGLAIDDDDNVYIADRAAKSRINVYDRKGVFLREIIIPPASEELVATLAKKDLEPLVKDVAVGKDGRIYAADNQLSRLVILDPKGKLLKEVGGPGQEPGRFIAPGWLAINAKGEVHVCNGLNRRIEVFDLEGNFVRYYGISKSFIGSFIGPTGITFDEAGNSIVVDSGMGTIQFFGPDGDYLYHMAEENLEIDKASKQRSALQIANPAGVVYYAPKKMIIFSQGADQKSIQGRVMLP
jgi:sugar lactone lactonase YvrE